MYPGVAESPGGPVRGSLDRLGREPGLSHFSACRPYPGEPNGYAAIDELRHPSAVGAFCVLAHGAGCGICCPQQSVLFAVPVERG